LGVQIGQNCKIQNGCCVYHGARLEDGVFLGPGVILTNDKLPRAINPDGSLKDADDWTVGETLICRGASLGAGAIVLPGLIVGSFAMVGAGAVVTRDVPDHGLVLGNPARLVGFVCACGGRLNNEQPQADMSNAICDRCGMAVPLSVGCPPHVGRSGEPRS
jgi:UDP-2-acetamido-3-amino-2,3-dideoxy-glucuronate N-acetyltransferase